MSKSAILASGNSQAWTHFIQWREYHHDSLTNAALAHYIMDGPGSEADYTLHVTLIYQNDEKLPIEKKFRMYGCRFVHKDLSYGPNVDPDPSNGIPQATTMRSMLILREHAARDFQRRSGTKEPVRMGTYLLSLKFGPLDVPDPAGLLPVYRLFQFQNDYLQAKVNPHKLPAQILDKIFSTGRKQRFCCGKLPGVPSCCCGGWTHDKNNVVSTLYRPRLGRHN